ncbi:hypothetical protein NTE_03424 [Candidatus Nitrososphaera evergladensis SR1]|uniref:Uncharacterized protein n=1 Tax=Candidatus Nitrososphaera evergladensis SR1 TaxID=1459636 RepID=A0A075MXV5_9ARCH|nr:hypothetical protein [Candidatus Nitrososphaera evergladensis]AIF85452.1 hypothetical protein NTE_03424 [Candidatus Nitrososphaera evergladensis SR1]
MSLPLLHFLPYSTGPRFFNSNLQFVKKWFDVDYIDYGITWRRRQKCATERAG